MRGLYKWVFPLFFGLFAFSYAEPTKKTHISLNGFGVRQFLFGGIAFGYSKSNDLSLRLKGLYHTDNVIEIKGGIRKFFRTEKYYGPFFEGGLGIYIFPKEKATITSIPIAYLGVGYRYMFLERFFIEGSLGLDAFFFILPLPKPEVGIGISF